MTTNINRKRAGMLFGTAALLGLGVLAGTASPASARDFHRTHVRRSHHSYTSYTRSGTYNRWGRGHDADRDGVKNKWDRDIDNDGRANWNDRDEDNDGIPNRRDRYPRNPNRY